MATARLERTVFRIKGEGARDWLMGLVTSRMPSPCVLSALLTPQGKIIADFFLHDDGEGSLLLETSDKFASALEKRLKMFRLRAPIDIDRKALSVYALWGDEPSQGVSDPRHSALGQRYLTEDLLETDSTADDYNAHRLSLGIVDSEWDFETAQVFPADANMDLLGGVDFKKGCFVGQEVVSRMHRKTSVRKRMRSLSGARSGAQLDTLWQEDVKVGTHLFHRENQGMALIRMDKIDDAQPVTDESGGVFRVMDWPYGR